MMIAKSSFTSFVVLCCPLYEEALASGLRCFSLLNNAAIALQKQGKLQRAFELYTIAIQENPRSGALLTNAGVLAEEMGNELEAINYYSRAVEADPLNEQIQINFNNLKRRLHSGPALQGSVEPQPMPY